MPFIGGNVNHRSSNLLWVLLIAIAFVSGCANKTTPQQPTSLSVPAAELADDNVNRADRKGEESTFEETAEKESSAGVLVDATATPPSDAITNEIATAKASTQVSVAVEVAVPVKSDQNAPLSEAAYLPKDVVGLLVAQPKRFFESSIGKILAESGFDQKIPYLIEFLQLTNLKADEVERVIVAIDQPLTNSLARGVGLQVANPILPENARLKNALKQIGLAFHGFHDRFHKFPSANGDGRGEQTGLSWRVHLLPFLDQEQLYNQFKLNEPWDSEHNKTLIRQMPDLFETPGVAEAGKTSLHVFTGEKSAFPGDQGISIREISDGTANTVLTIVAGTDKAEVWTKPGGLEIDLSAPRKSIGHIKGEFLFLLFFDGSVVDNLPTTIDDKTLALMIQPRDGFPINFAAARERALRATIPMTIVKLAVDARRGELSERILAESNEEMLEGHSVLTNSTTAVWFPDNRTVIMGPVDSVKQFIRQKHSGDTAPSPLVEQIKFNADVSLAFNVESQGAYLKQLAKMNQPVAGILTDVKVLSTGISAMARDGEPLVEFMATAKDVEKATQISAMALAALTKGQEIIHQQPLPKDANASDKEVSAILNQLASATTVTTEGSKIELRIPATSGYARVPILLAPTLRYEREKGDISERKISLFQIGDAFRRFHDVHKHGPGAGRMSADKPVGLSWRVYLLPYLGLKEAELYNQFRFNEPWDSEHNKALIESMPDIFKTEGVAAGKTCFHVFTGPGAPFAGDAAPSAADITDGLPNTILVVLAGTETAEFWTKPGGLDFDPKDPIKVLGNLKHDKLFVVMGDGNVKGVPQNVDPNVLRRYIQHKDGEITP
jgi:hypothetical protein